MKVNFNPVNLGKSVKTVGRNLVINERRELPVLSKPFITGSGQPPIHPDTPNYGRSIHNTSPVESDTDIFADVDKLGDEAMQGLSSSLDSVGNVGESLVNGAGHLLDVASHGVDHVVDNVIDGAGHILDILF